MRLLRFIKGLWYSRLRQVDIHILWPSCLAQASDLDHARAAFAVHAFRDPAWLVLGKDKIAEVIDRLN